MTVTQLFGLLAASATGMEWLVFIAVAYVSARFLGGWAVPAAHLFIAAVLYVAEVSWIQAEMGKRGWDGTPDMDINFALGLWMRIVVVNTVLLPVSIFGCWQRHQQQKRRRQLNRKRPHLILLSNDLNPEFHRKEA